MGNGKQVNPIFESQKEEILESAAFNSSRWIENEKNRIIKSSKSLFSHHEFLRKVVIEGPYTNIVDFGGSLGSAYIVLKDSTERSFTYTVVETKEVCEAGRRFIDDKNITFVESVEDVTAGHCEVVYIRTALQYAKDWQTTFKSLCSLRPKIIVLEHLTAGKIKTFQGVQNYYDHKVPYWFIGIDDLESLARKCGYETHLLEPCDRFNDEMYDKTIPQKDRIHQTVRVVMKEK